MCMMHHFVFLLYTFAGDSGLHSFHPDTTQPVHNNACYALDIIRIFHISEVCF
jgi:hypothetical protein